MRVLPIYFCKCCIRCNNGGKKKHIFTAKHIWDCADINGMAMSEIIPNVLYVLEWCKLRNPYK